MDHLDFKGQTLDGKYQMTRELGRGGMGTVYLATHLGTERPVAVKIISPQYMQRTEFVERFRREARAAGRLRHPNVVNVTDFGFSETSGGQVAYLVMEYLDGCTLGEILDEEKNLPVGWTLDILEQVCSAVQEAHEMGIIHRDLKPDNIWLEPNQRGGYTVKVLDFGIAKLEEHDETAADGEVIAAYTGSTPTFNAASKTTFGGVDADGTLIDGITDTQIPASEGGATVAGGGDNGTIISERGTIQLAPVASAPTTGSAENHPVGETPPPLLRKEGSPNTTPPLAGGEQDTAIFYDGDISGDFQSSVGTKLISDPGKTEHRTTGHSLYESKNSAELTRVGAVLGTPLYMSPEQCRGEHLDPRSDIYSLGVIAYQMLSGAPPFEGDFKDVMESHKTVEPAWLPAKKVRRKLKRAIHSALSKDPNERPQTAEAFASVLRARSEGIFGLLRRAMVIYSEHFPKFVALTAFFSIPIMVLTLAVVTLAFLKVSGIIPDATGNMLIGVVGFLLSISSAFCTTLIVGTISWIVTQYLAVPLRPIRLRPALAEARRKWKRIAGGGILTAILPVVVSIVGALAGFVAFAALMLVFYPVTRSLASVTIAGGVGAAFGGTFGFLAGHLVWTLVPPIIMLENVTIREVFRRSRTLVKRSITTSAAAVFINLFIPAIVAGTIAFGVNIAAKAFDPKPPAAVESVQKQADGDTPAENPSDVVVPEHKPFFGISIGKSQEVQINGDGEMDMRTRVRRTILESLIQVLWLPMQILVFSFSGIIVALLYLKTRLAGGESMNDLVERFEDDGRPRKKWQERVRQRLIQSGRISSNPSK